MSTVLWIILAVVVLVLLALAVLALRRQLTQRRQRRQRRRVEARARLGGRPPQRTASPAVSSQPSVAVA
jgi:hypothetical protein